MPPLMLLSQEFKRLGLRKAAANFGLMFQEKIRKRLPDVHTRLRGQAVVRAGVPARTLSYNDIRRAGQHEITRRGIGNDLFQVAQRDVFIELDYCAGMIVGDDLAVVLIIKFFPAALVRKGERTNQHFDILSHPAHIDVRIYGLEVQHVF